ncbi:hypothetical protein C7974DRAFT_416949 [Boeremia exigua]|uniref:uncharacterized protein n=1 Tax=Boeremia exigua TaxID=749465 RepID=UPI001E8ECBF4|nr:uncharacterized protein C7974DRAFT_416949 [Boeremia exigua]KAH6616839.1 hypothetical protein C7974DRAFT_416949 [Boeremia exigua]
MAQPMSTLSPEKINANSNAMQHDDEIDIYAEGLSSPFLENVEPGNQENIAPSVAPTPSKQQLIDFEDANVPQSAFKVDSGRKAALKERSSPFKSSPVKNLLGDFEAAAAQRPNRSRASTLKSSPVRQHIVEDFGVTTPGMGRASTLRLSPAKSPMKSSPFEERPRSSTSNRTRKSRSPSKSSVLSSVPSDFDIEATPRAPSLGAAINLTATPSKRPSPAQTPSRHAAELRDNEGLTVAANRFMEDTDLDRNHKRRKSYENQYEVNMEADITDFNPDATTPDVDDTRFSDFSEMPGLDMTKFASFRKSPTKNGDATPRARTQMTPSTSRRSERTPSPTPRRPYRDNDTTNLLLDFTAQIESLGASRNGTPSHGNGKSTTEPNLRSYYQSKRSPAKGGYTPSQNRPLLNLLDFELPPPPTPRSLPTVTIREMESLKSQFQSQISSLSASLSGKEAEVESLSRAIGDAERRVGEAHEAVRDERSARDYAEAQMEDWKKKGEEVQTILQDVQSELARNDEERDQLLARLADAERRAEDAEIRSTELETRLIDAESKNVDMTTFINNDEDENKKIYSEIECQSAIAEKVNEVARDLHAAYKAKHEKKIKALKENYQKKADERCKELRHQITKLERQIGDAEEKRDDTFSSFDEFGSKSNGSCEKCGKNAAAGPVSSPEDLHNLEAQRSEIESLKAKLAGLQSELHSLHRTQQTLLEELEAERVEKGELVAAAEQMLVLCGEKMESMQQEDFRRSQAAPAQPPLEPRPTSRPTRQQPAPEQQAMRNTGFLAGGSSVSSSATRPGSSLSSSQSSSHSGNSKSKPSGMRAPGGFGFKAAGESALSRSQSGASKSRLLSNIERMGSTKGQE